MWDPAAVRKSRNMPAVLIQNAFDGIVTDDGDARILLEIPSPIINVTNHQSTLKLVDIYLIIRHRYHVNRCYALRKFGRLKGYFMDEHYNVTHTSLSVGHKINH